MQLIKLFPTLEYLCLLFILNIHTNFFTIVGMYNVGFQKRTGTCSYIIVVNYANKLENSKDIGVRIYGLKQESG